MPFQFHAALIGVDVQASLGAGQAFEVIVQHLLGGLLVAAVREADGPLATSRVAPEAVVILTSLSPPRPTRRPRHWDALLFHLAQQTPWTPLWTPKPCFKTTY